MKFLRQIFSKDGEASSKRLTALWLLIILTVFVFVKASPDFNIVVAFLTAITAILGIQAFTRS